VYPSGGAKKSRYKYREPEAVKGGASLKQEATRQTAKPGNTHLPSFAQEKIAQKVAQIKILAKTEGEQSSGKNLWSETGHLGSQLAGSETGNDCDGGKGERVYREAEEGEVGGEEEHERIQSGQKKDCISCKMRTSSIIMSPEKGNLKILHKEKGNRRATGKRPGKKVWARDKSRTPFL